MSVRLTAGGAFGALLLASSAFATKPFTLVEDGYPEREKAVELEQTFGLEYQVKGDPGFLHASHELELEYGLAEDFTLRVAGTYGYEHSGVDGDSMHFEEAKLEGQYYFTNPVVDDIGLSVIVAATAGERSMGGEAIFVAQKDFDSWTVAANLGVGTSVAGVFDKNVDNEVEGTLSASLGAVYNLSKTVSVGGEIGAEWVFPDWSDFERVNVYAGPCAIWIPNDRVWVTAGVSYNVSGHADEPRLLGGLIVGIYLN